MFKNNDKYKKLVPNENYTEEQIEILANMLRNISNKVLDKHYGEIPFQANNSRTRTDLL